MKWRWLITACGLAVAVLAVSILFGPTVRQRTKQSPATRPVAETPPQFESGAEGIETGMDLTARVQSVSGYYVRRVSSSGRVSEFLGQTLEPLPAGRSRIGQPVVRLHLARGRLLQIAADQAELYAPDNQPQSGVLQGNVRLVLFEADSERPVNLAEDSPDVAARIRLAQPVYFDMLAGQIHSDGAVLVSSSQMLLRGQGLLIRYDETQSLITLLQVEHGEELRLARSASDNPRQSRPPASAPTSTPQSVKRPPTIYQATFEGFQEARSADVLILGDRLELIFSLQSGATATGRKAISQFDAMSEPCGRGFLATTPLPALLFLMAIAQVPPATAPADLFTAADDDVVVHWAGKLVVRPYEQAPPTWTAQDVRLQVVGSPVTISDARGPLGSAATLEYLAPSGQITLTRSPQHRLLLQTAEGHLEATQATLAPAQATGTIQGPGLLTMTSSHGDTSNAFETHLRWRDTLQLTFAPRADTQPSAPLSNVGRLGSVRAATLLGDAEIERPPYRVSGQRVEVELTDGPAGRLRKLEARGGAKAVLAGDKTTGGIEAEHLTLKLDNERDADQPAVLEASGDVKARSAASDLQSGWLRVELAGRAALPQTMAAGTQPAAVEANAVLKGLGQVRLAEAREAVVVNMPDEGISLRSNRLMLDGSSGKLELWGHPQQPAEVVSTRKDQGSLSAGYLVFDQVSRTANVPGPGTLSLEMAGGRDPAARRSTIRWQDSMQFDDAKGLGHFTGNVEVLSEQPSEVTRMTGSELTLELASDAQGHRDVRSARMQKDVVLLGERRSPQDGRLLSRLRLAGDVMVFDGAKNQAHVPGPGSLLFEQHAPTANPGASPPRVQFGGRGATLFTWRGAMFLDTQRNDVRMRQDVAMDYRPDGEVQALHLDCQELTADVEGAAGLSAWASSDAQGDSGTHGRPRLVSVDADRLVRVVHGERSILADHLHYSGDDETVTLRGSPQEPAGVRIYSSDMLSVDAKSVCWYLTQDKYEIVQPGATRVPLRSN